MFDRINITHSAPWWKQLFYQGSLYDYNLRIYSMSMQKGIKREKKNTIDTDLVWEEQQLLYCISCFVLKHRYFFMPSTIRCNPSHIYTIWTQAVVILTHLHWSKPSQKPSRQPCRSLLLVILHHSESCFFHWGLSKNEMQLVTQQRCHRLDVHVPLNHPEDALDMLTCARPWPCGIAVSRWIEIPVRMRVSHGKMAKYYGMCFPWCFSS